MKESKIEHFFKRQVEFLGGVTYKFRSPTNRGVVDRVACLPNGKVWFVELKNENGVLSALQQKHARVLVSLNQNYACLNSIEAVENWVNECM